MPSAERVLENGRARTPQSRWTGGAAQWVLTRIQSGALSDCASERESNAGKAFTLPRHQSTSSLNIAAQSLSRSQGNRGAQGPAVAAPDLDQPCQDGLAKGVLPEREQKFALLVHESVFQFAEGNCSSNLFGPSSSALMAAM